MKRTLHPESSALKEIIVESVVAAQGEHGYVEVLQQETFQDILYKEMLSVFGADYDPNFSGIVSRVLEAGDTLAPRVNRRGTEFLGVVSGSVRINGRLIRAPAIARIDPGEAADIHALERANIMSHIYPYNEVLIHQPLLAAPARPETPDLPLVSLIIIGKDIEHHIGHAIFSAIDQSYPNLEIIVIDDGSTDCTAAKCRSLARYDPRIQVHTQHLGRNGVRRFGLEIARGDYCLIIDGDDWLNSDAVEKLVSAARAASSDCVAFGFDHVSDRTSRVWGPIFPSTEYAKCVPIQTGGHSSGAKNTSLLNHTIWMYFFSSRLKPSIISSLLSIGLYEDLPFYIAILRNTDRLVAWNEILYHYRRDRVGQSTENWGAVSPARKLSCLEDALEYSLKAVENDQFSRLVLMYKIRQIADHEQHVCSEAGDETGLAAWISMWRTTCQKLGKDLAEHICDQRVQKLFLEGLRGASKAES